MVVSSILVDLPACAAVLSVSLRLSETCAKDARGKKEQKTRALKYIYSVYHTSRCYCVFICSLAQGRCHFSYMKRVTMIGPTLLKQWRKAIQRVQTYTTKFLSLRTHHLLPDISFLAAGCKLVA